MKQWKRLAYYLLLNILVSACTTLGILIAWDRTRAPLEGGILPDIFRVSSPATATVTPKPVEAQAPAATPTETFIVYQVVSGDTFESIATAYGVDVNELIAVNGFSKSQPLGDGEVLRIPVRPTASPQADITIENVIGASDLESERVVLRQSGEGTILLAGWRLVDENGDAFTFPIIELANDGFEISVFTKPGTNTPDSLYWGLNNPIWTSSEMVSLYDTDGNLRAQFQVP